METNACDERLVRNDRPFLLEKTVEYDKLKIVQIR